MNEFPTNMKIGETKSFFYRWETIPEINVVYDKNGNPTGYCGGIGGNRKLFDYEKVETLSGSCFFIPTKVSNIVDCCYDSDCPGELACDPTTYTCSENKPCNSDLECPQDTCSTNIETDWSCDTSKPWYPKSGTCVKSTKQVFCCSDKDCSADEYCNRNEGCKDKYVLIDCPFGKCCKQGGDYKPKECSSGMECCITNDPILGECKESCEEIIPYTPNRSSPNPSIPHNPEPVIPSPPTNPFIIIIIISLIVVGACGGYYFMKTRSPQSSVKSSGHCTKCGASITSAKFCTSCGAKTRRGEK